MTDKEAAAYKELLRLRIEKIDKEKEEARNIFCLRGEHYWRTIWHRSPEGDSTASYICWFCGEPKPVEKAKDGVSKTEERGE